MVLENKFAAESDMTPELLPTSQTNEQGSLESLVERQPNVNDMEHPKVR
jgi:hypothetical protein